MTTKTRSSENSHGARLLILKLYKNRGETLLECLERFKKDNPEYKNEKMTYAGRLDPLAEGVLLVLVGDECKSKEKYLGMNKEYEVDVLFGFATDTYDVLGIPQTHADFTQTDAERKNRGLALRSEAGKGESSGFSEVNIQDVLQSFVGKFSQKYPPFSSKTIKGKTLFSLFKRGELNDDEIPSKDVEIKSIELLGEKTISKNDLETYIKKSIALVKGDFRQEKILETWNVVFASEAKQSRLNGVIPAKAGIQNLDPRLRGDDKEYLVVSIRVNCTSGTYMRSLANSIGEKVGVPALALNIKRTKIG